MANLGDWEPFGGTLCDAVRESGLDGRLGATRNELLELENFGWEIGETEWEDDQVCIGWLGRLVGVRSRTLLVRRKSVRPGMRFINQQDVQVVATN